jgi:gliding-associated putative ABC transporter substrate-binding component GldG
MVNKQNTIIRFALFLAILVVINVLVSTIHLRFDLTKENRFTLSQATIDLIQGLDEGVYVEVYLEGDFPAGFKKLQQATRDMLNEFRSNTSNSIDFTFVNPTESSDPLERKQLLDQLIEKGLQPVTLKVEEDGGYTEKIIIPGVIVKYRGAEIAVHLLESQMGFGPQEALNHSMALLEYKLAQAIMKLAQPRRHAVLFTSGHGELTGAEVQSAAQELEKDYDVATFDLTTILALPHDVDVVIIARPTIPFNEQDKYKIDQYIMNGGKVIWFMEALRASMDSLQTAQAFLAVDYSLNLEDQLFKYGVRINGDMIQDLHCNRIPVVVGMMGDAPQTQMYPWLYYPIITSKGNHPISKNLDLVMAKFAATIDTVAAKGIKKTVLLATSEYSRSLQAPVRVHLASARAEPEPSRFTKQNLPIAVLLEGVFESRFKNRINPEVQGTLDSLSGNSFRETSEPTKMVVVSDADIIRNDVGGQGDIFPLGYYRYTKQTFANMDFIRNTLEYLTDQTGLIDTRSKEYKLRLLDRTKVKSEKLKWELINIVVPILIVLLLGVAFYFIRRKRFAS